MGGVRTAVNIHAEDVANLLFVQVGDAQDAITVELPDGVCVRIDPESERVLGLEILEFSRQFGRSPSTADEKCVEDLLERFGPQAQAVYREDTR